MARQGGLITRGHGCSQDRLVGDVNDLDMGLVSLLVWRLAGGLPTLLCPLQGAHTGVQASTEKVQGTCAPRVSASWPGWPVEWTQEFSETYIGCVGFYRRHGWCVNRCPGGACSNSPAKTEREGWLTTCGGSWRLPRRPAAPRFVRIHFNTLRRGNARGRGQWCPRRGR
jgi:hypothetical protein